MANLESVITPTRMSSDCGRKPKYYVFIILQVNECFQHYIASLVSLLEMETQLFFIVNAVLAVAS